MRKVGGTVPHEPPLDPPLGYSFGQPALVWLRTLLRTGSVLVAACTCVTVIGRLCSCEILNTVASDIAVSSDVVGSGSLDNPSALAWSTLVGLANFFQPTSDHGLFMDLNHMQLCVHIQYTVTCLLIQYPIVSIVISVRCLEVLAAVAIVTN